MKIKVKARLHPNSSREQIKKINEKELEIWIKEKPIDNIANIKLIKTLKRYFNKDIKIVSGFTSKKKVIEIK